MLRLPVLFALAIAALSVIPSRAADLEIGLGATHFNTHKSGTWYQSEFAHDLDLTSLSVSVGLRYGRFRIGYQYLGRYSVDAMVIPVDAEYDRFLASGHQSMPLTYIKGSGAIHGAYLMHRTPGALFVEYGIYVYRPTWDLVVFDRTPCFGCDPHQTFHITHKKQLIATPVVGFGYASGRSAVALNVRRPNTSGDAVPSVANRWAANLEIRRGF